MGIGRKNSWTDRGSVLILQHGLGLYARGVDLSSLSALNFVLVPWGVVGDVQGIGWVSKAPGVHEGVVWSFSFPEEGNDVLFLDNLG